MKYSLEVEIQHLIEFLTLVSPLMPYSTKSFVEADRGGGFALLPKPEYLPPCDGGR